MRHEQERLHAGTPGPDRDYRDRRPFGSPVRILRIRKGCRYERSTSDPTAVIVRKGGISPGGDGRTGVRVGAGKMFVVSPLSGILFRAVEDSVIVCINIDLSLHHAAGQLLSGLVKSRCETFGTYNLLEVNRWMEAYLSSTVLMIEDGLDSEAFMQAKVNEFVSILGRFYNTQELSQFFCELLDSESVFREIIAMTAGKVQSVGELARLVNMSRTGFHDRFKRIYGESPKTYLQRYRAQLIRKDLTTTAEPLKSIAFRYGFNSYEVFSRFCRRMMGATPGDIRKITREG